MKVKRHTAVLNQVGTDRKLSGRVTLLEEKVATKPPIVHSIVNEFQQTERKINETAAHMRVYLIRQNHGQRAWRDCTWVISWELQVYVLPDI